MQSALPSRWYQLSLFEWLVLTALFGIAWAICLSRPVSVAVATTPGSIREFADELSDYEIIDSSPERAYSRRRPPWPQVTIRLVCASVGTVLLWLSGANAVRHFVGSLRPAPHPADQVARVVVVMRRLYRLFWLRG